MKNTIFAICISIQGLSLTVFSQDWKSHYDEAVKLYQEGNYTGSLASAKLAYPLAKNLDQKSIAYTLQLITANYLQAELPDDGIQYAKEEIDAFRVLEGPQSKSYAEALKKEILLLQQAGKLNEAQIKTNPALTTFKTLYGESSYPYAALLAIAGQLSIFNKQTELAKQQLYASLALLEKIPEAGEDYLNTLSISAGLDRQTKDANSAEVKYKKLIQLLEQNDLRDASLYSDAKKNLSELILLKNNVDEVATELSTTSAAASLQAQAYLKLAIDSQQKNDVVNAFKNYTLAKEIVGQKALADNTAFSVYVNAARFELDQKKYDQSLEDLTKSKSLSQILFVENSIENQIVESTEADLLLETGKIVEATKKYETVASAPQTNSGILPISFALASAKRLLNYNHPETATLLLQPIISGTFFKSLSNKDQLSSSLLYNECLIRNNQIDAAISNLTVAIRNSSDPEDKAHYQLKLSEALISKGAWNESLTVLNNNPIQAQNTTLNVEWRYQMARLQQLLGLYKEAEANYREAVKLSSGVGVDRGLPQQVHNSSTLR